MNYFTNLLRLGFLVFVVSCSGDDSMTTTEDTDTTDLTDETIVTGTLHAAFEDFSSDIEIVLLDDDTVSIETDGLPNHTSPYWSPTSDLYTAATVARVAHMSPGYIDDFEGTFALQVSTNPQKASRTTATSLGAIGIAVSGAVIYNQNEAGNIQITENVASGLDYNGAHTGPSSYHYHFEPTAFTDNDSNLVGVIADGFFLYGRKCYSTGGYPTDLDSSNGHTSVTQYNDDAEYHYHIGNTTIYNEYYVNFTGDYQGTPYRISGRN
ncbi:YHYH protein [Wenyingzhuangia sp. 1_MG-2023]|nr:YHYH protein [Wenyingzhuangia sp. 1_MG-2023]